MALFRVFFFFNDTATTEIYTLSLHDALPIFLSLGEGVDVEDRLPPRVGGAVALHRGAPPDAAHVLRVLPRSEEHTSELQSRQYLVCRLLLEKKKPYPARP